VYRNTLENPNSGMEPDAVREEIEKAKWYFEINQDSWKDFWNICSGHNLSNILLLAIKRRQTSIKNLDIQEILKKRYMRDMMNRNSVNKPLSTN